MTHVLVIGNSHTAALRAALGVGRSRVRPVWQGMAVTFAAGFGTSSGGLRMEGDEVLAADEEAARPMRWICGIDRFRLPEADAVVLCGGLLAPHHVIRLWNEARWHPLPSAQKADEAGLALVSEAVARAALHDVAQDTLLAPLLQQLRAWGRLPLLVLQGILLSRDAVGSGKRYTGATRVHRSGEGPALADLYDDATLAAYGHHARVILQPTQTRVDGFFTHPSFRRGATRLSATPDAPQPPDDMMHANAEYGALMLDAIRAALLSD